MKRKIVSVLLCVSMCAALLMGCGQSDNESAEESKTTEEETTAEESSDKLDLGLDIDSVTVATSPGYEPFEFEEDGELKGYDVESVIAYPGK